MQSEDLLSPLRPQKLPVRFRPDCTVECEPRRAASMSAHGQHRSRRLCAHVGCPRSLLTLPEADVTSLSSAGRDGWKVDILRWVQTDAGLLRAAPNVAPRLLRKVVVAQPLGQQRCNTVRQFGEVLRDEVLELARFKRGDC